MENNDFAKKFAKLRRESGITQQKLGDCLGVSNRAVSKWETGLAMPSTENIRKLAKIFDVPIDHFFSSLSEIEKLGEIKAGRDEIAHRSLPGRTRAVKLAHNGT